MNMQSAKSAGGKIASVALLVALGSMSAVPIALADAPDPAKSVSEHGVKTLAAEAALDATQESGSWKYVVNGDGTATITGFSSSFDPSSATGLSLPSHIDGKAVTSIGAAAFEGSNITKLTIPSSVESLGDEAFMECKQLESVSFEEGSHLKEIGAAAFCECSQLKEFVYPGDLEFIGESAFAATSLANFDGAKTSIRYIGNAAFAGNGNLESVTLPDTLEEIPNKAFYECTALESITIPATVKRIGASSFYGCSSLRSVYFLNPGMWELGACAFCQEKSGEPGAEIPLPGVTAYGYSSSPLPSYVPAEIASFKSLDITLETPFERRAQATVGKPFQLNGLCQTGAGQLSYQWYLDNDKVDGATSPQFSFTLKSAGTYLAVLEVTNSINPGSSARFPVLVTVNSATSGGGSSTTPVPGADAGVRTDISSAVVPSINGDFSYTGHPVKPSIAITYNGRTLDDGIDYTVSYKNNVKPGTATMIIEGFGEFAGRVERTFTISKLEQKLSVKTKAKTLSAVKLTKRQRTITCITGSFNVEGKLAFKKLSGAKTLKVNGKTGKITVAKGVKKGVYKAQVEVKAAPTDVYNGTSKIVVVSVRVK